MDNAAFHDDANGIEVARILRKLADGLDWKVIDKGDGGLLIDIEPRWYLDKRPYYESGNLCQVPLRHHATGAL